MSKEQMYDAILTEVKKENREAQLGNILSIVKYFNSISLSQQNEFIFTNTDIGIEKS